MQNVDKSNPDIIKKRLNAFTSNLLKKKKPVKKKTLFIY